MFMKSMSNNRLNKFQFQVFNNTDIKMILTLNNYTCFIVEQVTN